MSIRSGFHRKPSHPSRETVFTPRWSEKHIYALWDQCSDMKKMSSGEVSEQEGEGSDRTMSLIETLYARRKENSLILHPD